MKEYKNYVNVDSLELIIGEIDRAIETKNFFAALYMSLSIPDMLGKLAYPSTIKNRYIKWFDDNVKDSLFGILYSNNPLDKDESSPKMNGEVCYALRNKIYHEGNNDIETRTKARINEFVLSFSDDDYVMGDYAGKDYDFKRMNRQTGEIPSFNYLYISCKGLCKEIVRAAKDFRENNPSLGYPKIRINKNGGHISPGLFGF